MSALITKRTIENSTMTAIEIELHPYLLVCDVEGCGYKVVHDTLDVALYDERSHICPRQLRLKDNDMVDQRIEFLHTGATVPLMWKELDNRYAEYHVMLAIDPRKTELGILMRGMANMLYLVMRPYYASSDGIIHEVMRRHKEREFGNEPVTPGIGYIGVTPEDGGSPYGEARYGGGYTADPAKMLTPPPGYPMALVQAAMEKEKEAALKAKPAARATEANKPKPIAHGFSDEQVATLKAQHAQGFDAKMLAMANDTTEAKINLALRS